MEDNNSAPEKEMYIGPNEFVFNLEDGKQLGGGFSVPAILQKAGFSPIAQNISTESYQEGGAQKKVSDLFEHLAVPHWAIKYNMVGGEYKEHDKKNDDTSDSDSNSDSDSDIDDDLHDKLLDLVKQHDRNLKQKHKKTTRNPNHKSQKTKNTSKKNKPVITNK